MQWLMLTLVSVRGSSASVLKRLKEAENVSRKQLLQEENHQFLFNNDDSVSPDNVRLEWLNDIIMNGSQS